MGLERTRWLDIIFASARDRQRRAEAKQAGCSISITGSMQKHSDILQLPGAAFIDKGGKILWLHRGASTSDLPSAETLFDTVTRLL
jgi:hypothetical protein